MARPDEFTVTFDEKGEPQKGKANHRPENDRRPDEVTRGGPNGVAFPTGTITDIKTVTLVRTQQNPCCWWINLGGQWYCMPVPC